MCELPTTWNIGVELIVDYRVGYWTTVADFIAEGVKIPRLAEKGGGNTRSQNVRGEVTEGNK